MSYSDGFFNVSSEHGFLPMADPQSKLPPLYADVQAIIDDLPTTVQQKDAIEHAIIIQNHLDNVNAETDMFVLQALYRAYTFIASAYTLEKSFQQFKETGEYGKARTILPRQIAEPLVAVSAKLNVFPWLDYHYAYSLGNYVKKDATQGLHWSNLDMACKFTNTPDETGFIMVHVYINELSAHLIQHVEQYWETKDSKYLEDVATVMHDINERRREMWRASRHERYNDFRVFIMGIKGNDRIFGDGVIYENCFNNEPQQYRGQTGAQDNIIPLMDIFTGIVNHYPENQLTQYLLELRAYRPACVQRYLQDAFMKPSIFNTLVENGDINGLRSLLKIVDEVYYFRNGHWQFVQKYIMSNTKYAFATGGTPITSWLINQIECVLHYQQLILQHICDPELQKQHDAKVKLLCDQVEELKKVDFNVDLIYAKNVELKLADAPLNGV